MPTGIDRVELAYLQHLSADPVPFFAIARTTLGYVLLDASGAAAMAARFQGLKGWGRADRLSVFARGKPDAVRQAESDLRRFALGRCRPRALGRMLRRHLPKGTAYLNTGHSNLTGRMIQAIREDLDGRIAVLIHDAIPLDFPELQRPGAVERYRGMLTRTAQCADLVIHNSAATRDDVARHIGDLAPGAAQVVAHLGVCVPVPAMPREMDAKRPDRPYFVTVGTIEPRKNHGFLLDLWDEMRRESPASDLPGLVICGARGWQNQAVFDRLDALSPGDPVREFNGLSDAAIAALLVGSQGLLFPSMAEGYGLPPIEAAALGVPMVCVDLPACREVLADIPVYAEESDRYQWKKAIERLIRGDGPDQHSGPRMGQQQQFVPPDWADHFNKVLRFT